MKKIFNVILASFLVLGMIGCANAAGGDAEFKVEQNGSKAEFTLSNAGSVQNLWVSRRNVTNNTDFEQYIYVFKPAEKNVSKITDYFVSADNTYEYIFKCYTDGKQVYKSKIFSVKADSGIGELVINNTPASTFDNKTGILTFDPMPSVSEKVAAKIGKKINYFIDYEKESENLWFEAYISEKNTNCPKFVSDWNQGDELFGKDLTLTRFGIEADIDNVGFNKFYFADKNGNIFGLPKNINIPDTRVTFKADVVEAGGKKNIKFTLPTADKIPSDSTRWSIGKKELNNSSAKENKFYIYKNNNVFEATDENVEVGKSYQYTLYYLKDTPEENGILVSASKPLTVDVK